MDGEGSELHNRIEVLSDERAVGELLGNPFRGLVVQRRRTPVSRGHLESVELFLKRGAALNKPRVVKDAPKMLEVQGTPGVAVSIVESGNMAMRCGIEATPLAFAAMLGQVDIVRFLLQRGADPNAPGENSLVMTLVSQNEEVVRLLLDAGARKDAFLATLNAILEDKYYLVSPGVVEAADRHGGFDGILRWAVTHIPR